MSIWAPGDEAFHTPNPQPLPAPPDVIPTSGGSSAVPLGGNLSFSNSDYGGVIPIVFGSDRLTGNIIWASAPLTINTTIAGQPFTYQAMRLAIGICEGEINGVLRMWVGGSLAIDNVMKVDNSGVALPGNDGLIGSYSVDLTDPAGVFVGLDANTRQTKISVFNGSETQFAAAAMVEADGYENTPAYRGLAYIVLENFIIEKGTIPPIILEITSHTTSQSPRLFGDFVDTTFDTWKYQMLQYDPSYDRFYAIGQKTSPAAKGLEVIDGNSLTELAQFEIDHTYGIGPFYDTATIMPTSGLIAVAEPSGNAGYLRVLNPRSGGFIATIGPGGNLVSHSLTDGFAVLSPYSVTSFSCLPSIAGTVPVDVFCGVGEINQSVGFATIASNGAIEMVSTLNAVTPYINNAVAPLVVDKTFYATPAHRTFHGDGGDTLGTHVYGLSWRNNESESILVWRVTVASKTVSLDDPVYVDVDVIPVDIFGGTGFGYDVRLVMVDHSDNSFILIVQGTSRGAFIAKYNPFLGKGISWVTPVSDLPTSSQGTQGPNWGLLNGTYAWIDGSNAVWMIDLKTGSLTQVMAALSDETLPALSNARQFYNGLENSITYLSGTATKHITKFFINRLTRTTVELSDIVVNLIERTGLLASDINVVDLSALTLYGYTISSIQSIRACFSELGQAFIYDVVESNGKILYKTRGNGVDATVPHAYIAGKSGGSGNSDEWLKATQANDGSRLRKINLTYRDLDRDYASNVQSVILTKYGSQVFDPEASIDVTVPIVLTADQAKILAEILLYAKLTYNTTFEFTIAPRFIELDAADVLTIAMPVGEDDLTVRLRTVTVNTDNSVVCQASEENSDIYTDQVNLFSQIGRFEKQVIPPLVSRIDPIVLTIAGRNVTEIAAGADSGYHLYLAFLNSSPDTVLVNPLIANIDGVNYSLGAGTPFPTWGYVITPPNDTFAYMATDYDSTVVVDIASTSGAQLASATGGEDDLLANDQINLCYIAGELFQFTTATNTSGNRWELTGLHRAKLGSDVFVGAAVSGDRFILLAGNDGVLDDNGIFILSAALGSSPNKLVTIAVHTNNPFQPLYSVVAEMRNLKPWLVADFAWSYVGDDVVMTWQRRGRTNDGSYPDDGTVPPAEDVALAIPQVAERYGMFLYKDPTTFDATDATTFMRQITGVPVDTFTYTAAMQTTDGFDRTTETLYCTVYEIGNDPSVDIGDAEQHALPPA